MKLNSGKNSIAQEIKIRESEKKMPPELAFAIYPFLDRSSHVFNLSDADELIFPNNPGIIFASKHLDECLSEYQNTQLVTYSNYTAGRNSGTMGHLHLQ